MVSCLTSRHLLLCSVEICFGHNLNSNSTVVAIMQEHNCVAYYMRVFVCTIASRRIYLIKKNVSL
jgi:hypothetical protein